MGRLLAFAAYFLSSLPVIAATQEEIANAPVQTADPIVVWVFLICFVGAIVAGCIWYFRGSRKEK